MIDPMPVGRRQFLALSSAGLLIGARGLTGGVAYGVDGGGLVQRFLAIAPDGAITVFAKHVDMGQGIWSGLAAIVAEELDAEWSQVHVTGAPARMPDYGHTVFGVQATGASTSIANSWTQLRMAGAVARSMILSAAAARWKVSPSDITIVNGVLLCGDHKAGLGVFAAAAARLPVPKDARPKAAATYRIIGKERGRLDLEAKTRGRTRYGIDTNWDRIKTAVVARGPRFGSVLSGYDDSAALALPGVVEVVQIPSGVAVIGQTAWHALRGRAALVTQWEDGKAEKRSSETIHSDFIAQMENEPPTATTIHGDPAAVLTDRDAKIVEAAFEFPYLAHAAMEPISIAGRLVDGNCYLRGGFQAQTDNQKTVARILGIPIEKVFLETVPLGGSFGRRATFGPDWIDEIGHLLKATDGRWPLKLLWSREDDITGGHYRPMTYHVMRAALGDDGRPVALDHRVVGQSCIPLPPGPFAAPDIGVSTGSFAEQYECGPSRLAWWLPHVGIVPHTYRAVSNNHAGVAKEIFVDRLARAAGQDPVAYRLSLLSREPRQAEVLRLAAEKIGWSTPPANGVTRGVAVHRADDSYVAQIVEVSGTPDNFRIERVMCVVDCGQVIDPDTVRAQVEGGAGFGLSSALFQQIRLDETGKVIERNYHNYRILRITEMPRDIEVHIVENRENPTGIGEPGSVPVVAAVINALERMGGPLVRRFPVVGEKP